MTVIVIHRGKEPNSLLKYRKSNLEACYEEIPKDVSEDIRNQMWREQKGLCAYCMKQIKSPKDVRIEHYSARHPENRKYEPKDTLDYKKMLGVCYGNSLQPGIKPENRTCDAHRGNTPLTVNPYDISSIRKICYKSSGYITSEDGEIRKDVEETLNLNCQASSLPESRKRVLAEAQKEIYEHCKNKNHEAYIVQLEKIYRKYIEREIITPYCGIVIAWLEKELKIS